MSEGKRNRNPRRLSVQIVAVIMLVLLLFWYFLL